MTAREARKIRRAAERQAKKIENRQRKALPEESLLPEPRTRAEINRANAAHSTGPRTAEGKAKSKDNSFKHGLYSSELVLPDEDPAELDELRATLRAEHQPANETEGILVNEIADNFWRLRRMRKLEARGMQPENFDSWLQRGLLALVARNMASAERSMHKAIAALRQMRSERTNLARQTQSGDGFVPSNTATEPEDSKFVRQNHLETGFVPSQSLEDALWLEVPEPESPPLHVIAA